MRYSCDMASKHEAVTLIAISYIAYCALLIMWLPLLVIVFTKSSYRSHFSAAKFTGEMRKYEVSSDTIISKISSKLLINNPYKKKRFGVLGKMDRRIILYSNNHTHPHPVRRG